MITVADPGEGPEGPPHPPSYCLTELRPEWPKINFLRDRPPPLSQGLHDPLPPSPFPHYLKVWIRH